MVAIPPAAISSNSAYRPTIRGRAAACWLLTTMRPPPDILSDGRAAGARGRSTRLQRPVPGTPHERSLQSQSPRGSRSLTAASTPQRHSSPIYGCKESCLTAGAAIASLAGPGVRSATSRATMDQAPARTPLAAGPRLVGRRLTLCVSGSIAAYKAAALARLLLREGALVQPLMTRSAAQFLGQATLAGLTGRPVQHDLFGTAGEPHVEIARWSELLVIAPATADLLSRLAQARADDLITA